MLRLNFDEAGSLGVLKDIHKKDITINTADFGDDKNITYTTNNEVIVLELTENWDDNRGHAAFEFHKKGRGLIVDIEIYECPSAVMENYKYAGVSSIVSLTKECNDTPQVNLINN